MIFKIYIETPTVLVNDVKNSRQIILFDDGNLHTAISTGFFDLRGWFPRFSSSANPKTAVCKVSWFFQKWTKRFKIVTCPPHHLVHCRERIRRLNDTFVVFPMPYIGGAAISLCLVKS